MGFIKRFVAYWAEGILGFIGLVILVFLVAGLSEWVGNSSLGVMTGLGGCSILLISASLIGSLLERYGSFEHLNDYEETLFEEE